MDIEALETIVGASGVITDTDVLAGALADWTGRYIGHSQAMVTPQNTAQVAAVVNWCQQNGVALVPQGGNTGMVGGSVPMNGELVLSTRRMTAVTVDPDAGVAVAQAGTTLAAVQDAATEAGWHYGVDLGARDTATIGGTVATNAGGLQVLRYGDTRHQLLGVEAVTGAGETVGDLRGLHKDNTGYHLPSLLAGSEGTLAVVTQVCLRLHPKPVDTAVALIGFSHVADAVERVPQLRRSLSDLQSLELILQAGIDLVCDTYGQPQPFREPGAAVLVVEVAGPQGVLDRFGAAIDTLGLSSHQIVVGEDRSTQQRLWRYREAHTEAIATLGVPIKLDVTIPQRHMASFLEHIPGVVGASDPDATTWLFGHAGDGNIHVNITGADPTGSGLDGAVLEYVAELGGSISAEHGIGRAKANYLRLNRSQAELDVGRRLKDAFDPNGILNPGVIFLTC